ncbi:hypothetical protein DASC09_003040 [Saccharomycopsis crataegensis]|uniref:CBS domain-containing protein n=1 Tax=Saccharomycopsis crataegensis TaxID=43959 RepID=A0AAV5QE28_9ASCO|nr:hypothetical protein DASC09_003040 [Saccharomycopsis crataegensis]
MSYRAPSRQQQQHQQQAPGSYTGGSSTNSLTLVQKPSMNEINDSRKRQAKRDEAIRRKIENDFSKKRKEISGRGSKKSTRHKAIPGSVSSLRPNEPILCKTTTTVLEAARLMGAKRENCILVVDDKNRLVGIITAKDLAFRVVASEEAPFHPVEKFMTKNPLCVTDDTPAGDTLNLMVQKGFRHLPILDSEGQISGVLDITKSYQEAMEKLERMYESSKKLYDALDNVNQEIGMGQQPFQVVKYFENLKDLMGGPVLENVLDETTLPVYTNVKSSVLEAAKLMEENRTTAVLVKDSNNEEVTGIFTSKDIVLRVIASGLNPSTCSIVRVMTPQPDCATKDLTIHEALRKMFDGHYLNLPVIEDNEIIGIVEVLKLTYATLNQLKVVKSNEDNENPIWNRFWTTLDDTDSMHSDSFSHPDSSTNPTQYSPISNHHPHNELTRLNSEVRPTDSISCANERVGYDGGSSVHDADDARHSFIEFQTAELPFGFKFKSPTGRVHRITVKPKDGILTLRSLIMEKLQAHELKLLSGPAPVDDSDDDDACFDDDDSEVGFARKSTDQQYNKSSNFAISYRDDEGDLVAITTDQDLTDCVLISKKLKFNKADIFIHNPRESIENILTVSKPLTKNIPTSKNIHNNSEHHQKNPKIFYAPPKEEEFIPGVPNQLLLPGAIVSLAISILVVFTFSGNRR